MRQVWPLEILGEGSGGSGELAIHNEKSLRWTFANPDGWQYWVYNPTPGPITTGAEVTLIAKIFGVWVK